MQPLLYLTVYTINVLSSFSDPFEFAGDYGAYANEVRGQVFEQLVSKEALAAQQSDAQLRERANAEADGAVDLAQYRRQLVDEGRRWDREHGPTLGMVASDGQLEHFAGWLRREGFGEADWGALSAFVRRYGGSKIFSLLRHMPPELMGLDKALRDAAARDGRPFALPIVSSTAELRGGDAEELKRRLADALFEAQAWRLAAPPAKLMQAIARLEDDFLASYLPQARNEELLVFSTPVGQLFYYWLYQALNLQLVADEPGLVASVNAVKADFKATIGDDERRAATLRSQLLEKGAAAVFTQESDARFLDAMTCDNLYWPADRQNGGDGTVVLLRGDLWQEDYQVVAVDGYEGWGRGRLNVILAHLKGHDAPFLLASAHGNSTDAADGRRQISLVMEAYRSLLPAHPGLQLVIGIDANTKSEADVAALRELLGRLGLQATALGPTTVKQRMVTVQHSKAGRLAVDEEDYLITLRPAAGGRLSMAAALLGFHGGEADRSRPLPNADNLSDHYPVGALLVETPSGP